MALVYKASLPLPLLCGSVQASIGVPAIAISAAFSGNLSLSASLALNPPTVAAYIAALAEIEAQMNLAIGLSLPSVSFTLSDLLAFQAELELGLGILVTLEATLLASIGMYSFAYEGVASGMGAAVTTELATQWPDGVPTSGSCDAIILGAVASASVVAPAALTGFLNGLTYGPGLIYTGKLGAIADLSVVTALAIGQGESAINFQLNAIAAIMANLTLTPPALSISVAAWARYAAYLRATIALGPPSVSAAVNATANAAAALDAQFSLIIQLGASFGLGGQLFCYTYSGAGDALGPAITTALASTWGDGSTSSSTACTTAILATTSSADFAVMTTFFSGL